MKKISSILICLAIACSLSTSAATEKKNILSETRKADTWFKVEKPFEYKQPPNPTPGIVDAFDPDAWNPGPSGEECARAWMIANEFVYQSILREQYKLPASGSGLSKLISSMSEKRIYIVNFESKHDGNRLSLLVDVESFKVGIIGR